MDIRILGELEVLDDRGYPVPVQGERQRELLVLLALAHPRHLTRRRIIDSLWSDEDIATPERALQVVVSRLRKAIGADTLRTLPDGYGLDVEPGAIDLDRFRRHAKRGLQMLTLGHPGQATEAFHQALAQWRGPAPSEFSRREAIDEMTDGLERERIDVLESLMEAMVQTGDHKLVVGQLESLVDEHPMRERLWYLLMLALYRSGRQVEALEAYSRLRRYLARLGIEPSPDIANLEERILLHDPELGTGELDGDARASRENAEKLSFRPGDLIVEEGTQATAVYWIEEGEVEVFHRTEQGDRVLARLGQGQYFGELASLLETRRTASVRAVTPTIVSVHTVRTFRERVRTQAFPAPSSPDDD